MNKNNQLKKLKALLIILLLGVSSNAFSLETLKKISIHDGDTIRAFLKGKEVKIRLAEIDTPELKQDFGVESKKCLEKFLYGKDRKISFKFREKDKYGRLVGWLYSGNLDVNFEMVKTGCAWAYERYAETQKLFFAQSFAQRNRLGLWKNEKAIPPWVWRQEN